MTSHGIPALPAVLANQRAFSRHVTSIVEGRETSNVVLTTMGNTKSFIQLINMHRPRPCITSLGVESDNKTCYKVFGGIMLVQPNSGTFDCSVAHWWSSTSALRH